MVLRILRSQQYLGLNVWARRQQRMYGPSTLRPRALWVTSKAPFKPIIDQAMFDLAQQVLAGHRVSHTSKALLASLKRAFVRKGRLTGNIIDRRRAGGCTSTYINKVRFPVQGLRASRVQTTSKPLCDERTRTEQPGLTGPYPT
jgi:Recombinase